MSSVKNIPRLRFPEFDGNWSVIDIKDVFSILNGYAFSSLDSQEKGVKWVKIADVGVGKMVHENVSYLPESYLSKHKKFILKKGDFVVALTRPILSGKLKISPIDDYYHNSLLNQRVGKIETKNESVFIYNLLRTNRLINTIENNINGSEPPNLSPSTLNGIKVDIPSLPEQQKIANFLTAVDKRIELLEKKKTLLETYKKGVMKKIFNQEIRFKDDDGNAFPDWEEKKVKDVFRVTRGNVLSVNQMTESESLDYMYPVYSSQTKNKGVVGYYNEFLFQDSLTWTTDGANAGEVNFRKGKFYCTNVCGVLISENGFANECISNLINSVSKRYVSYVGNPKLMNGVMAEIKLAFPSIKEQVKISEFLVSIDIKIDLLETQIVKSKTWKKGLLQKMFV